MALVRGLADREVVVKEGPANTSDEVVGEGAKFVQRGPGGTVDWAGDFLGHAGQAERAGLPDSRQKLKEFQPGKSESWIEQYDDQPAVTMTDRPRHSIPERQRRKSVHFDDAMGDGVPSTVEEASASRTAIPGMTSAWTEDEADDFDEDIFMAYNGEMRQAHSPRIGIGALEGWGELQKDWEEFQRVESDQTTLRGMERGDLVERYMFQSKNPYPVDVMSAGRSGRESPTSKVRGFPVHGRFLYLIKS